MYRSFKNNDASNKFNTFAGNSGCGCVCCGKEFKSAIAMPIVAAIVAATAATAASVAASTTNAVVGESRRGLKAWQKSYSIILW